MDKTVHKTVVMSSKGQIVLPHEIRDVIQAKEGNTFEVILKDNLVVLKKVENVITKADLKLVKELEEAWKTVDRKKGLTPEEFFKEIEKW